MLLIPEGYGQLTAHIDLIGWPKSMSWSCGYQWTSGDASAHATTFADALIDDGAPYFGDRLTHQYGLSDVSVIENHGGAMHLGDAPGGSTGTHAGSCLPPNCSLILRKVTGLGGRKNQGRMFLPAAHFGDDQVDQYGTIEASNLSALQTAFRQFLLACDEADLPLVLLHSSALAPTPIQQFNLEGTIGTQRRRLR